MDIKLHCHDQLEFVCTRSDLKKRKLLEILPNTSQLLVSYVTLSDQYLLYEKHQ